MKNELLHLKLHLPLEGLGTDVHTGGMLILNGAAHIGVVEHFM